MYLFTFRSYYSHLIAYFNMRDEELFKNKTDEMIESFIEKCEKESAKLEITVDYYIKEFVVDF